MTSIFDPQRWRHTLRRRAKTVIGTRPSFFFPLFRPRSAFNDLLVTESTDICIEGFPRSANSFAVEAVRHAQPGPVKIAHHTHVPANAMRACEWDIPTIVLIRSPYDAIVSRVALRKEVQITEQDIQSPRQYVSFAAWLHAWCSFYESLVPYWEQRDLLVVPFQKAIQDMGRVIEQINAHFGVDFTTFDHTDEAVAVVRGNLGYHAGPNDRRARLKEETRADFDEALRRDTSLQERMDEGEQLLDLFVERS